MKNKTCVLARNIPQCSRLGLKASRLVLELADMQWTEHWMKNLNPYIPARTHPVISSVPLAK